MQKVLVLSILLGVFAPAWAGINPVKNQGVNAIYGVDDRELVSDKSAKEVKQISQAVALIVSVDVIDKNLFGTTIKAQSLKDTANMCISENFVTRPSLPACTGFLIASNLLATAGHCFESSDDCASKKIIFDVTAKKQSKKGYSVSSSDVFSCEKIIAQEVSDDRDFAIIQLDRAPKNRTPLKISKDKKIASDAKVFMVGHPMGMPQMLSKEAQVSDTAYKLMFKVGLDSFEGNSGSPVINSKTLLVEGILFNGQEDFVQDAENECYRNRVYDGAGNEGVSRISDLLPYLN